MLLEGEASERFVEQLGAALEPLLTHAMLTPSMRDGFEHATSVVGAHAQAIFTGTEGVGPAPRLYRTDATSFIANAHLREEMFGPAALVVTASDLRQVEQVLAAIGGTLTATLWGADDDTADNRSLVHAAEQIAGRVLFKGVPTGVAVCSAQQHGGPWPASTAPQTTSLATRRLNVSFVQ